jgi:Xaa-Pro aminopeptidase
VLASDLAALARLEYARAGLEFRWGLVGHGIGLVIHEEPQLLLDVHDPIVEGMTMEIELGYFGDGGGYHIEDLIHVTANGAVNLTQLDPDRRLIESGPA